MGDLNKKAYDCATDNLISDIKHAVDIRAFPISLTAGSKGIIKRGQVIDIADGKFKMHESGGKVNCIVAEGTEYSETDDNVICPVYITGDFNMSALISEVELTDNDIEVFRGLGIFVK